MSFWTLEHTVAAKATHPVTSSLTRETFIPPSRTSGHLFAILSHSSQAFLMVSHLFAQRSWNQL